MPIRFALYPNPFKKDKEEMIARAVPRACAGDEEVMEMILRRNSGLSRSEVMAVLEEYTLALECLLREGYSVHTSLMKLDASIQGKFRDRDDRFDAKRHRICLNITPGKRLRGLLKGEKAYHIRPSAPRPVISQFIHFDAQLPEHSFLPGMLIRLTGHRLKVNTQNPDEGIFVKAENQQAWKVAQYITNEPAQLFFMMPADLPAGTYSLQVHCRVGNSTELRKDVYPHLLSCQPSAASE
ncbi:MAG: DNA-binding domain-containing protein [Cyclobacteriaceae bacterium]